MNLYKVTANDIEVFIDPHEGAKQALQCNWEDECMVMAPDSKKALVAAKRWLEEKLEPVPFITPDSKLHNLQYFLALVYKK